MIEGRGVRASGLGLAIMPEMGGLCLQGGAEPLGDSRNPPRPRTRFFLSYKDGKAVQDQGSLESVCENGGTCLIAEVGWGWRGSPATDWLFLPK